MAAKIPPLEQKYVKSKIANLNASLVVADSMHEKRAAIIQHMASVDNDPLFQLDPEFPLLLDWFNSPPLSFAKDLKGKIVVLDFFTYCCINCMHVLPDLESLEEKYHTTEGVVVVGVHSAKFGNEKMSENIKNAIERYGITHPVVNDKEIELWDRLGVTCWPTLVIIGPNRQLLHFIIGEGHGEELQQFMDVAVKYYKDEGCLNSDPLPLNTHTKESMRREALHFPGKICLSDSGERLFVSDSSNHRILVVDMESNTVQQVLGSGKAGYRDGVGTSVQFDTPQGIVFHEEVLYVADTGNHMLRKVELFSGVVSTVTGTGVQGKDKEGGAVGVLQEISSPWDVEKGQSSPDAASVDLLFIAMAGTHQIWIHFLKDAKWTKGREFSAGCTVQFSGSGEEANRNNSYPHKACFAQPSGISNSDDILYVADSESSTVRCVAIPSGSVKALVGGAIDPLDLFAFGDTDGKGRDARLQHPLGVAWNRENGIVYVADSYNHKIKVVNPRDKSCTTLSGTGEAGLKDGPFEIAQFSEPGGLCIHPNGQILFIADTNNHIIRKLDLDTRIVSQIELSFPETIFKQLQSTSMVKLTGKRATTISLNPVKLPTQGKVQLNLLFKLPQGCRWTEDAPSAWQILPTVGELYHLSTTQPTTGSLRLNPEVCISLATHFSPNDKSSSSLQIEALCYICEASGLCHMKGVVLVIPLLCSKSCDNFVTVSISHSLQL